jgi:hypothetical protein
VAEALDQLEDQRTVLLPAVDAESAQRLSALDLISLRRRLPELKEKLGRLTSRFSRPTLNIGVVGRARQGKSRLLQSLTGLTTKEIPDGDRLHCTGVRSTILHQQGGETHGKVTFHSEASFLTEVLTPYYHKLKLGHPPLSWRAFASANGLPPLPSELADSATAGAQYEHLCAYYAHFDKYRDLLGAPSRTISADEIRSYVAQDSVDGQRIYYQYLAVREVKIFCTFPNTHVGQIGLVDMPGLGDTGLGDEERLIGTLGREVDCVLFVRFPKASGDHWADVDVRLYDTARQALPELPLELWSFMILNRTQTTSRFGDNAKNCKDLSDSIEDKHLHVVRVITVDCSDAIQTHAEALDPLLDYLAHEITTIDQRYAASCQQELMELQREILGELRAAQAALSPANYDANEHQLFSRLFKELYERSLANGFEQLLAELHALRRSDDPTFKRQVDAVIAVCRQDTGIPSEAAIETRRNFRGSYQSAYSDFLHHVRAHLSQHFLRLDEALQQTVRAIKDRVCEVLKNEGRLAVLSQARGCEFLQALIEQLPQQSAQLKFGLEVLLQFELSYRGFVQHRIRKQLDILTPDATDLKLSATPSAREIERNLTMLHKEALYHCDVALRELLSEPGEAVYAIVEEFVDRVFRAKDLEFEWNIFYHEARSDIWPAEFNLLGEKTRIRRQWQEAIAAVEAAVQREGLRFVA